MLYYLENHSDIVLERGYKRAEKNAANQSNNRHHTNPKQVEKSEIVSKISTKHTHILKPETVCRVGYSKQTEWRQNIHKMPPNTNK